MSESSEQPEAPEQPNDLRSGLLDLTPEQTDRMFEYFDTLQDGDLGSREAMLRYIADEPASEGNPPSIEERILSSVIIAEDYPQSSHAPLLRWKTIALSVAATAALALGNKEINDHEDDMELTQSALSQIQKNLAHEVEAIGARMRPMTTQEIREALTKTDLRTLLSQEIDVWQITPDPDHLHATTSFPYLQWTEPGDLKQDVIRTIPAYDADINVLDFSANSPIRRAVMKNNGELIVETDFVNGMNGDLDITPRGMQMVFGRDGELTNLYYTMEQANGHTGRAAVYNNDPDDRRKFRDAATTIFQKVKALFDPAKPNVTKKRR
ncbi:hypothetical protein KBD59_06025 [Candidatus Gracilibacteria bacterium]|nr:hypothetical protein [Candidatus Gracilibacteria bacterium]